MSAPAESAAGSAPGRRLLAVAGGRETRRLLVALLVRRRGALVTCGVGFALLGLAQLVAPLLMGRTVDVVLDDGDATTITGYAVAIAVAAVVAGLATVLAQTALARSAQPALADLREQVVDRVLHLPHHRVEEAGVGDLVSRVGDDVRTVNRSLETVVPLLAGALVAVVFTLGGLAALDWRLGLAGAVALPMYALGLRWYLPRSGPFYRRERVAQGERAEALVTGLQAAPTLRAYALEQQQLTRIREASWGAVRISIEVFHMLTRFFARNNRAECVGLLAVLTTGYLLVRAGSASVGEVTAAALFFHRIFNPLGILVSLFDEVQSAGASLTRLAGVALLPTAEEPPAVDVPAGPLEVRGLTHAYLEGEPVVHGVDLIVADGERVALVGASGAGKTTLGAVAAGVLRPTAGQVLVGGVALERIGRAGLRTHVALVSQDVHVFSGTVRDSVTLVDPVADDGRVRAALERVRALAWVEALPAGLDTVVGEHGHHLTPMQAQQLALARVELLDPRFVVLDEATAEAGSAGARDLERAALAVTQGRGALVIAHRLGQAAQADRVVVMDAGRVVEQGTHRQLVAAGGRYAELWEAWSG